MSGANLQRQRYLVCHDYGMGALWWWLWAKSADDVVRQVAEVEVIEDVGRIRAAETWPDLEEQDLDNLRPESSLASLAQKRAQMAGLPGFGRLAGRERVWLRMPPSESDVYFMELNSVGRQLRQVILCGSGVRHRSGAEDWPFNAPFDLWDPYFNDFEITSAEFEAQWREGVPNPQWQLGPEDG